MLSPTMLVLLAVIGLPILAGIRESFYTSGGLNASGFVVGGRAVRRPRQLHRDLQRREPGTRFWQAIYVTTMFTVVCVVIEVVIGVAMALIMNRAFKGRGLIRASILIPWAVPTVVSALLWKWIFNANGVANDLLGKQVLWSTDGVQAQLAVIIADTWKTAPFIGLLVLAGLQVIPGEVYEAAKIDGSSAWNSFLHITLPLVKPALLVAVLFRILDNLRMFDLPFVLVGVGKPSVETLSILAQQESINTGTGQHRRTPCCCSSTSCIVAFAFVKLLGADVIGDNAPKTKKVKGQKRSKVGRTTRRETCREHHDAARDPGRRRRGAPARGTPQGRPDQRRQRPGQDDLDVRRHRRHHHLLPGAVLLDDRVQPPPDGGHLRGHADPVPAVGQNYADGVRPGEQLRAGAAQQHHRRRCDDGAGAADRHVRGVRPGAAGLPGQEPRPWRSSSRRRCSPASRWSCRC